MAKSNHNTSFSINKHKCKKRYYGRIITIIPLFHSVMPEYVSVRAYGFGAEIVG